MLHFITMIIEVIFQNVAQESILAPAVMGKAQGILCFLSAVTLQCRKFTIIRL